MASETPIPSELGAKMNYDPQFKGPVKERSCTDVLCLFLFVSFIVGWVIVSIFAFRNGNPSILIYPTDSQGNVCGMFGLQSKPYLFFFDLTKCASPSVIFTGCQTPQVCVSNCPNETFVALADSPDSVKGKLICKYATDMTKSVEKLITDGDCAQMYLQSKPVIGRCVPSTLLEVGGNVMDSQNNTLKIGGQEVMMDTVKKAMKLLAEFANAKEFGKKVFSDFKSSWKIMLIFLICVMVVSFIWVTLMRWLAGIMVWLSMFATMSLLVFICYHSVNRYIEMKKEPAKEVKLTFTLNLSSYLSSKTTWLTFAIISGVLFLILFLVLVFLRKRIIIAIALIKEASKAVGSMMSTLIFPILPYILELAVCAFAVAVSLFIASSGKGSYVVQNAQPGSNFENGTTCEPSKFNATEAKCIFESYGGAGNLYPAHFYNLFGVIWGVFFIIGIGHISLAGAFSSYYWTLNKSRDVPYCAIVVGFYRCIRFHLGSIAFGSLLVAIVRFVRIIFEYLEHKCKKYQNPVTRAIACCMKCCFWLLEKFLKFINKNAYIMIAVYGKNFCASARIAFDLLLRNVVRVFVLDKVTAFILFIGKLVIVGGSAVAAFYVFTGRFTSINHYVPELNYNFLPVIVVTFFAYIIASIFFTVYEMAVDTLFLCFLEDLERNDGSPEKPYYMSKELMKILNKKNKYREPEV